MRIDGAVKQAAARWFLARCEACSVFRAGPMNP